VAAACGADAALRDEVELLIAHDAQAGDFLEWAALDADLALEELADRGARRRWHSGRPRLPARR
jgi:hypothetical protein